MRGPNLEVEGNAATNGARRLHQIKRATILAEDGNVSLSQQITNFNHDVHVPGQRGGSRQRLAEEEVEERIRLSSGSVEHVDRSQGAVAGPSVRSDPAGLGAGSGAAHLGGKGRAVSRHAMVARVLQTDGVAVQFQNSAIAEIDRRSHIGRQLALQHQCALRGSRNRGLDR